MAVDRGGIFYEIVVDNKSAASIQQFRDDIRAARADFRAFKVEIGARRAQSEAALRELDKLAQAGERAAASARRHAQAEGQATVKLNQRARAVLDANAAFNKKVRADNASTVSAERNFAAERRAANAARQRARAEDTITKVLEARQRAELILVAARERGVRLTDDERVQLRLVTQAERDLIVSKKALAAAQTTFHDKALLQIQAETAALQRLVTVERQRLTNAVLSSQGKTPQGKSKAVEERLAAQAAAREAAAEDAATPALNRRARAILAVNAAFNRKVQAEDRAAESARRNFALERRALTQDEVKARVLLAVTRAKDRLRVAQERLVESQRQGIAVTNKELFAAKLLTKEQFLLAEAKERQRAASLAASPELARINAETAALRRQTRAREELLTKEVLAARGLDSQGRQVERPQESSLRQRAREFLGLGNAVGEADSRANRASFTFRRLFGILAAFTAVRLLASFFRQAVVAAVKFNATLERATLGIAGVVAAVGDVRDVTGKAVSATQKLSVAEGIARKQVEALRKDALLTTATFEELADAFQKGIGPGLAAGLDIDQVRKFTRQISIAASSIGLEQRQLSEEIRSILAGTIKEQNTRIAAVLGIDNEDIRKAKEAGNLFEFLQKKFQAFDAAGKRAARTLPGLFERIRDASVQILGAGAKPLAGDLKLLFSRLLDQAVKVNEVTGEVTLNPEMVEMVELVMEGFRTIVSEAERLQGELGAFGITVQSLFRGIGETISFIAVLVSGIIEGAVLGIGFVFSVLRKVRDIVQNLTGFDLFDPQVLRVALVVISAVAAASLTISLLWASIGALGKLFLFSLGGILVAAKGAVFVFKSMALVLAGAKVAAAALGISASVLGGVFAAVAVSAIAVAVAMDQASKSPFFDIGNLVFIRELGREFAKLHAILSNIKAKNLFGTKFLDAIKKDFEQIDKNFDSMIRDEVSVGDAAGAAVAKVGTRLRALFSEIAKESAALFKPKDDGSFILEQSQALEALKDRLREVKEETEQNRDAALAQARAVGIVGAEGQQQLIIDTALTAQLREHRNLQAEELTIRRKISAIQAALSTGLITDKQEEARLQGQITALTERATELDRARVDLTEAVLHSKLGEVLVLAKQANFESQQENAVLRIQAAKAEILRKTEEEGDVRRLALTTAEQELALFKLREEQEQASIERRLEANEQQRQALALKRKELLDNAAADGLNQEDLQRLQLLEQTSDELDQQKKNLSELLLLTGLIGTEEAARLERNRKLADLAGQAPIFTGLVEAFAEINDSFKDKFTLTLNFMRGAIQSFSDFAAQSIVSAFDPTDDSSLKERFARFLQGLATQILSTLISLAVTMIVLNAATSGILGATVGSFAALRTRFEGGPAEGRHEGGRAAQERQHRFSQARGYLQGGNPGARRVHGVARPLGLHPKDTVPLWADPSEWIIRGSSVAKAGADAVDRFNRGLFDPYEFRAAVGLRSFRRSPAPSIVRVSGLAAGGPASSVRTPAPQMFPASQQSQGPIVAIIAPSEQGFKQQLSGGRNSMLEFLYENGFRPQR